MTSAPSSTAEMAQISVAKTRVALVSLIAAVGLLAFKLAVGWTTGSLGILAEAAHSALDLLASSLTFVSIRIADRPADEDHQYGHGKFESFSAFLETGLLLLTAVAVMGAAVRRLLLHSATAHINQWAFVVVLTSIAVDLWRSRALARAAAAYRSEALEADALNFSTDLLSSTAVLAGIGLAWLGARFGYAPLLQADSAGALFVSGVLIWLALKLGRRTAGTLLDEVPAGIVADLRSSASGVPGVLRCERIRARRSGSRTFIDLRLAVERTMTQERARQVGDDVRRHIENIVPGADVTVETQPGRPAAVNVLEEINAVVQRNDLTIHDLAVYDIAGELDVELHLEVKETLSLKLAHDLVSGIEAELRREIPSVRQIITHIEPESAMIASADLVAQQRIAATVEELARQQRRMLDCHDVQVRSSRGHLAMSCHCTFPDNMPMAEVHEIVTDFEAAIKRELPELFKVTIHTEPGSDNRR
jgi:cation diffusion facilitator family transporter